MAKKESASPSLASLKKVGWSVTKFIPLDKSWIIRVGVLDVLNGYDDINLFLNQQSNLGSDLSALKRAVGVWKTKKSIDVRESGTLYRFLQFASWKYGLQKEFVLRGTLKKRSVTKNSKIINWPLKKLLRLDGGTSQWASAAVLAGSKEKVKNPPYKLELTYKAVSHWKKRRKRDEAWQARYDETIKLALRLQNGAKIIPSERSDEGLPFMPRSLL